MRTHRNVLQYLHPHAIPHVSTELMLSLIKLINYYFICLILITCYSDNQTKM